MDRRDARRFYKENWATLRSMGVYRITCRPNGKVFVEASLNLEGTLDRERVWLARGGHMNRELQQDWERFGPDAFTFEVLETLTPTDEARNYAEEAAVLLACWKEKLEPYGEKGYHPVPWTPAVTNPPRPGA
jgi:hypothetical protein